jgi:hypothetical protein
VASASDHDGAEQGTEDGTRNGTVEDEDGTALVDAGRTHTEQAHVPVKRKGRR